MLLLNLPRTFILFSALWSQGGAFKALHRGSRLCERSKLSMSYDNLNSFFGDFTSLHLSAEEVATATDAASEAVSLYSKVDKTGFIGFFADGIEKAIDLAHSLLQGVGVQYSYGFAIIIFTILIKAATLPLTSSQIESTTKMQKMQPLQERIKAAYPNDEQTRNKLVADLFQAAKVNPLAGCLPALVQIPVFISLYRAIQNLIGEDKLEEPFLWIPNLQGPVFSNPPGTSMDWLKSVFTGNPILGWHDTLAYLSLPVFLYVSQTISQKVLQPPRNPNKVMTEQEEISQGLVNNLPFIVAFFAINVPAGLGVYWVANNILTTLITVLIRGQVKDEAMPLEVERMMAVIERGSTPKGPTPMGAAVLELKGSDDAGYKVPAKKSGFGVDAASAFSVNAESVADRAISVQKEDREAEDDEAEDDEEESAGTSTEQTGSASSKKGKTKRSKGGKKKRG